ncbi:hypothetical protein DERP_006344 [Dermatophagoides pteronyssinus]|uniref:Uncharacterized protein n=1 Tax=Dermatophagoides pteronyssinus TaxID=6956 RepID=A0ABQ8IY73_DERPT|nr:hypothetical protein DERP_006344 [Dermatophagoides pteronyssinus]
MDCDRKPSNQVTKKQKQIQQVVVQYPINIPSCDDDNSKISQLSLKKKWSNKNKTKPNGTHNQKKKKKKKKTENSNGTTCLINSIYRLSKQNNRSSLQKEKKSCHLNSSCEEAVVADSAPAFEYCLHISPVSCIIRCDSAS